jgi:two-component system sensor histidine kinase HydH
VSSNNISYGILLAELPYMTLKTAIGKFWEGLPPWILLGAVAVLFPIFAYITYENINRQKENSQHLLLEKGAALIRSFEAGTRTGVMGTHWDSFKLQHLLTETAQQPDIRYLMVTDLKGRIVAHSNPRQIGRIHGNDLDLAAIARTNYVTGRIIQQEGQPVFEVVGRFAPTISPLGRSPGGRAVQDRFQKIMEELGISISENWIIFLGLDMGSIETAQRADMRHAIVMGVVLLLIGFGGFVLLILFQSNRATRLSLSRIKAFSNNLVENMPIGLVALDTEKTIATVNHVAASMLGLKESDVLGKKSPEVLPPQIHELIQGLDKNPSIGDQQIECRFPDGRSLPVEATATILKDESDLFFGYVLLFKDLSELQALRKEVARSQRLATVGRLAGGVAHEIRNPLSSIKGFATYFKERYPDIPEDQQIAGIMIQEVDKLNRVVGQLLEFSRPIKIVKKWVSVSELISDSLKLIENQAKEKNIAIKSGITPRTLRGFLDPDRIHQVLLNLYLNAIEAMETGGTLEIAACLSPIDQKLLIQIKDTGPGIDPENMAHIFDPYYTTKPSGTGLGLAIVHNIIEAHHGRIVPNRIPQKGLAMSIYLPLPDLKGKE